MFEVDQSPTSTPQRSTPDSVPTTGRSPATWGRAGALLALQRQACNRAVSRQLAGAVTVSRDPSPTAEADRYINDGDWARASASLAALDAATSEPRLRTLPAPKRQYLTEGARHVNADALITLIDGVNHRDAVIGSVRFSSGSICGSKPAPISAA